MGVDIAVWRARIGRFSCRLKRLGQLVPGDTVSKSVIWYGVVVLMLLVISGVETNPGPSDVVVNGPFVCNDHLEGKVSNKRKVPMSSSASKKQRLSNVHLELHQVMSAITKVKEKGKYETPLHLLKPYVNPLFKDICEELHKPNNDKMRFRIRLLWQRYMKSFEESSRESACGNQRDHNVEIANVTENVDEGNVHQQVSGIPIRMEKETQTDPVNFAICETHSPLQQGTNLDDELENSENVKDSLHTSNVNGESTLAFSNSLVGTMFDDKDMEKETVPEAKEALSTIHSATEDKGGKDIGFWEFLITSEDWAKVKENDGKYSWFLVRELIKLVAAPVFRICLINFTTHRQNMRIRGEPVIVYYGKCKHEGCRQFRFDLVPDKDGVKLTVSASGQIRHNGKLSSRLSGLERSVARQELLSKKALAFRSEKILKADAKTVLSGNLLEIRSLDVFRQARAEAAKMMDKHNDDGIDLLLRFREDREEDSQKNKIVDTETSSVGDDERIIQKVGEPLHVFLFSKIQLKTLLSCSEKKTSKKCVLHIDSTGSVVRHFKEDKKTVYYYSGCVNCSGKLLPIFDLVSCQHDVASITSFFLQFLHFQKKHFGNRSTFTHIVTDFSTALVPAVILAWNKMTVLAYLKRMFRYCSKSNYKVKGMVTLHLCCSHFMHMAAGDFSRLGMSKDVRKFYLCCIASMIDCSTFEEFKSKVSALLIVAKSKESNAAVEKARMTLEKEMTETDLIDEAGKEINEESAIMESDKNTIYKASPFYKVGKEIEDRFDEEAKVLEKEKAESQNVSETKPEEELRRLKKNDLQCSEVWDLFLTKYMPYAPLWSGFLIRHSSKEKIVETRFSNAPVEGWFKIVKESVLDGLTNLKVGRFVERLRDRIISICKELYLDIPTAACNKKKVTRNPKNKEENNVSEKSLIISGKYEEAEEKWIKRPVKKTTYFSKKFPEFGNTKDSQIGQKLEESTEEATQTGKCSDQIECKLGTPSRATSTSQPKLKKKEEQTNERTKEYKQEVTAIDVNSEMKNLEKVSKYGPLQLELQPEDFESLQGTNWVTGAAMDAVAERLLRIRSNFTYVYVGFDIGTRILHGEKIYSTSFIDIEGLKKNQYLLIPYSTAFMDSHWCLVVADLKRKTVFHLDSLEKGQVKKTEVLPRVLQFLGNVSLSSEPTQWRDQSETIEYPKQTDSYNCGIFVLYYLMRSVEIGLRCGDTIEEMDMTDFRRVCSDVLQDSDRNVFLKSMKNGLIDLPMYYTPNMDHLNEKEKKTLQNMTIAYKKNKNMGRYLEKISQTDFASLTGNNWLTSIIVDFCNAIFVKDGQFCFAIGEATFVLQEGRPKYTQVFKPISTEFQKLSLVFVPYNVERHFCLYVIDIKNKMITHLDPMNSSDSQNEKKCEKIKEFLRIRNRMSTKEKIDVDGMKFKKIEYPLQNDGSSCGVYTIFYVAELTKKDKIDDIKSAFNCDRFRKELQTQCLRTSQPMIDLCLVCGNGSDQRRHQWCQCRMCGRWLHYVCMETDQPYECLRRKSITYSCLLCRLFEENKL